jgi:hypothetical protein
VAGTGNFDFVAVRASGVPAFEIGIDGAVCSGDQHPAGFTFPCSGGDDGFEIIAEVEDLGSRHEIGLRGGQVGREIFMKVRRIDVSETIGRLLYCTMVWAFFCLYILFSGVDGYINASR